MHFKTVFVILVISTTGLVAGCQKAPQEQAQKATEKTVSAAGAQTSGAQQAAGGDQAQPGFKPFYVYDTKGSRENHFIPSGFMPNGNCLKFKDDWRENCYNGGATCIRNEYDVACSRQDMKWAGIYWLNPANNWGTRKGGFDLTGAQKLTFWAKGEKGGEQIQEFTIGGITGDYPDSDTAVIGPVILGSEWKQYTIDLRGKDLSYISGGFAWTTSEDVNPENCVFYLDDIRYE